MNTQIVTDESVAYKIVTALKAGGLTVYSVAEELPSITDKSVLSIACDRQALLLTEDKDFGKLVFCLQPPHNGILLIRIQNATHKVTLVIDAVANITTK